MIFELATLQCTLMGDKLRLSSASLSGIKGAAMEHGQSGGIAASNLHYGRRYGQRLQWCLLAIAFVVTFVFLVVFSTDRFAAWKVPSAYLLLLAAPASLPLSARIASFGPSPAPTGLLLIGTLFVVGGASLDWSNHVRRNCGLRLGWTAPAPAPNHCRHASRRGVHPDSEGCHRRSAPYVAAMDPAPAVYRTARCLPSVVGFSRRFRGWVSLSVAPRAGVVRGCPRFVDLPDGGDSGGRRQRRHGLHRLALICKSLRPLQVTS
jgi:hypothetical protein